MSGIYLVWVLITKIVDILQIPLPLFLYEFLYEPIRCSQISLLLNGLIKSIYTNFVYLSERHITIRRRKINWTSHTLRKPAD